MCSMAQPFPQSLTVPLPQIYNIMRDVIVVIVVVVFYSGRTVRVSLSSRQDYPVFLELAVGIAAFDWVYYADRDFVRLSVIPSSKQGIVVISGNVL